VSQSGLLCDTQVGVSQSGFGSLSIGVYLELLLLLRPTLKTISTIVTIITIIRREWI
jgi:hypothetical protein